MKSFLLALIFPLVALSQSQELMMGQTVTIVSPASSATMNGFQYPLTATLSGITSAVSQEWQIGNERLGTWYNCSGSQCPTVLYDSSRFDNGTYGINVIIRDFAGTCVAVAAGSCSTNASPIGTIYPVATQQVTVSNSHSCNDGTSGSTNDVLTVTPSTATSSTWATVQTLTVSASGSTCGTSVPWEYDAIIDGKTVGSLTGSSGNPNTGGTITLQTQQQFNSTYSLSVVLTQTVNNAKQYLAGWQSNITISNVSANLVPVDMLVSAKEAYFATSGGAQTITGTERASDLTTTARTPSCVLLNNIDGTTTAPVTVSGNCTLTPTGTAGAGPALVVDPVITGSNLVVDSITTNSVYIASGSNFAQYMASGIAPQWAVLITGGTGWTQTAAVIEVVQGSCPTQCRANLYSPITGAPVQLAALGTTGGQFIAGPANQIYIEAKTVNSPPHFTRNGGISTAYVPNSSFISTSLYNSGNAGSLSYANYQSDYTAAGFNTLEWGTLGCSVAVGSNSALYSNTSSSGLYSWGGCGSTATEAAWKTNFSAWVTGLTNLAEAAHLYLATVATSWAGLNTGAVDAQIFDMTSTAGTGYNYVSGNVWTQALNYWNARATSCTPTATEHCYGSNLRIPVVDEAPGNYGGVAVPGSTLGSSSMCGTVGGTCAPINIVGNGSACVATYPNVPGSVGIGAGRKIIIQGATTSSALNISFPTTIAVTTSANTVNFPCSFNGTATSATDPTLTFNVFAAGWNTSTAYVLNNAIQYLGTKTPTSGGHFLPSLSWPAVGNSFYTTVSGFMADPRVSSHADLYFTYPQSYVGLRLNRWNTYYNWQLIQQIHANKLPFAPADGAPACGEGNAITGDYAQTGAKNINVQTGAAISVVSFTGDILTMSGDHGLRGVVPGVTRVKLSGMSNSADNGIYFVRAIPNSTQNQLVWCGRDCSLGAGTGQGAGATWIFDNGDTENWQIGNFGGQLYYGFVSTGKVSDIGHTFTCMSGCSGFWATATGWYGQGSDPTGVTQNTQVYSVPVGSSTSGNVEFMPDNSYYPFTIGVPLEGPAYNLLEGLIPTMAGMTCTRDYLGGVSPQAVDSVSLLPSANGNRTVLFDNYTELNSNELQVGAWAPNDNAQSRQSWWVQASRNTIFAAHPEIFLSTKLASPDVNGDGWYTTARGDSCATYGNGLMIQSFWDNNRSVTATLTPYECSGQAIWKYYSEPFGGWTVTQIAAGTATDTTVCGSVCTIFYLGAKNASTAVTLATVCLPAPSPATDVYAQYNITPYPMSQISQNGWSPAQVPTAHVSAGGCGTIPYDINMGNPYLLTLTSKTVTGAVIPVSVGAWHK